MQAGENKTTVQQKWGNLSELSLVVWPTSALKCHTFPHSDPQTKMLNFEKPD